MWCCSVHSETVLNFSILYNITVSQVREIEQLTLVDATIDDSIIDEIVKTLETLVINLLFKLCSSISKILHTMILAWHAICLQ